MTVICFRIYLCHRHHPFLQGTENRSLLLFGIIDVPEYVCLCCTNRMTGGLHLPNTQWYYWTAQLRTAMYHFISEAFPSWMELEMFSVVPKLPLNFYIYSADVKKLKKQTNNPFVLNTIKVWYKVRKFLGEKHSLSCFSPIWSHQNFAPGKNDPGFQIWANKGLRKVQDLYRESIVMSFEELTAKYDIPSEHFFLY